MKILGPFFHTSAFQPLPPHTVPQSPLFSSSSRPLSKDELISAHSCTLLSYISNTGGATIAALSPRPRLSLRPALHRTLVTHAYSTDDSSFTAHAEETDPSQKIDDAKVPDVESCEIHDDDHSTNSDNDNEEVTEHENGEGE